MAAKTPTDALSLAPASATKTALIAAADAFVTAVNNCVSATTMNSRGADLLNEHFVDLLEIAATNMKMV